MTAAARQLEDALARLERLERKLDALLARGRALRGEPELLTKRAAARILACDRVTTLEQLIRSGRLRTVLAPSGKGLRIPRAELERVLRDGPAPAAVSQLAPLRVRKGSRTRTRGASAAEISEAIRAITVPRLDE